jgi:hypothetical protein
LQNFLIFNVVDYFWLKHNGFWNKIKVPNASSTIYSHFISRKNEYSKQAQNYQQISYKLCLIIIQAVLLILLESLSKKVYIKPQKLTYHICAEK